ncbi:OmpA family protein [Novosphingobium sp. B1]|uniref:OmpA family protein n=1 Tax=Novosphingobium sp. B1 TaxID=1938756 RepID=UPI001C37FFD8|nr:OmpA family protein [Novosphingobium sp. B1]
MSVLLASCQRPVQPLRPPPSFDMQGPTPAPLKVREDEAQSRLLRDHETPATVEDFERYAGTTRVLFARDSAELDAAARAILDRHAQWLNLYPEVRASLQGHADEFGSREHQFALGEKRAAAMKFYLTAQGVAAERLVPTSFGKEHPARTGGDEISQNQNRRGETVLIGLPASARERGE